MSDLIEQLFASFSTVIEGLAEGIKSAFTRLLYVDYGVSDAQFSPIAQFIFVMAGVGLATGILYKIFGMIRARKG